VVKPMEGVRVLEVAQYAFVPSAGAVLADWGAEVIKVEHAERGDAQRGIMTSFGAASSKPGSSFAPIVDGPNRGKLSIGLALEKPEAAPVLRELVRRSDVFLTNFLPGARSRLGIDVDAIRAVNPDIVYAVGAGFGQAGPEAGKGGYDATAFWARGGSADAATAPDADRPVAQPTGAYGDSLSGLTLAGGVAAALFARDRTGRAAVVDVSLLGVGAWATQLSVNQALMAGGPVPGFSFPRKSAKTNPLVGNYRTADGRWLMLTMLQPGKYWPGFCAAAGRPELAADERFDTSEKLMAVAAEAADIVEKIIASRTKDEWAEAFARMDGQWSVIQDAWEVANDESLLANGQIADITDADGEPQKLVGSPVRFDGTPPSLTRGPLFAEHTDEILRRIGYTDEQVLDLKIAGAVT
jgi:crotonobetainyl-CoA:carnitine CoA-transferase CaiB-like acyl-CoA transferase